MDPLSLTANIIAVVGAAESAARSIRRLTHVKEAPEQILQLQNEVSDARIVITSVQETLRQRDVSTLTPENTIVPHVQRLIVKSEGIFMEITTIAENCFIKYSEDTGHAKISWRRWIRNHSKIERLSASLCDARRDLATALVLLTTADMPSIRVSLRTISMETSNFNSQLATLVSDSHATYSNTSSLQGQDTNNASRASSLLQISDGFLHQHRNLRLNTSVHRSCRSLCACICHRETKLRLPNWMESIVGTLFLGYSGMPTASFLSSKCTEVACQRNRSALISVQYCFPRWFLAWRMIILRNNYSSLNGIQISVRTPRVVGSWTEIFAAAQTGNVGMIRLLISEGRASPFDVAPDGSTPIWHAIVGHRGPNSLESFRLLLSEGADVEQKDNIGLSPLDQFCSEFFIDPLCPSIVEIKNILTTVVDLDESLLRKRFTALHKIVLKLSNASLEDQLLLSTSEIETKCARGRTPLDWAALIRNTNAIRLLVKFGANIGADIIHYISNTGSEVALKVLIEEIRLREISRENVYYRGSKTSDEIDLYIKGLLNGIGSKFPWTPLFYAAIKDNTEFVRLLLALDVRIETKIPSCHPISAAIHWNSHSTLKLLLSHKPALNCVTADEENILHTAAESGDFRTISILHEYEICCIDAEALDMRGNTPLQKFDLERRPYCSEDESTNLQCRQMLLKLLESVKIKSAIPSHDCWKEEFFETCSNLGAEADHIEELE